MTCAYRINFCCPYKLITTPTKCSTQENMVPTESSTNKYVLDLVGDIISFYGQQKLI